MRRSGALAAGRSLNAFLQVALADPAGSNVT
jgi:hypothetical protein